MVRPLVSALLLIVSWTSAYAQSTTAARFRILFVGNSLTSANNLPAMVEAMGDSAGLNVSVRAITLGNAALEDHWNRGEVLRVIREGGPWDAVVLQQGPSGQPASRENLVEWAGRFGAVIRAAGAEPVMYMVWPDGSRLTAFDSVGASYRAAAGAARGAVAPAADAWTAAWRANSALALYGPDNFHPSVTGSYLAALTISSVVFGRAPSTFPARLRAAGMLVEIDLASAALMHAAVARSLAATH